MRIGLIFCGEFWIVDRAIEFLSGAHAVDPAGLGSGGEEIGIELFDGFKHDSEGGDGVDDHLVAEVIEFVGGDQGGFAELGHVGEERSSGECGSELLKFVLVF